MGVYTWQDGRKYEGEYKDDKKHGYGVYTWQDGRIYEGYWFRGKQHGLGRYAVPDSALKHGLWEEGKRIEWFEEDVRERIERGEFNYTVHFKKQESAQKVDSLASFEVPQNFHSLL